MGNAFPRYMDYLNPCYATCSNWGVDYGVDALPQKFTCSACLASDHKSDGKLEKCTSCDSTSMGVGQQICIDCGVKQKKCIYCGEEVDEKVEEIQSLHDDEKKKKESDDEEDSESEEDENT